MSAQHTYALVTNSDGQPLGKRFEQNPDGSLQKTTAAHLAHGTVERVSCTVEEFAAQIATHQSHQARTYGLPELVFADIVTQADLMRFHGAKDNRKIARDREHFGYRATPSILFLDYDPAADAAPITADDLRANVIAACPALKDAPMVCQASSSSFIYDGEREAQGARGWHLYIFVADGRDIERAGKAFYERLWLRGFGRFAVSSAGTLLDRNLIDRAVWQPERLDFSGAYCAAPLTQRRPAPKVWNVDAEPFDSRLIAEPTSAEQILIDEKRNIARRAVDQERNERREAWLSERTNRLVARGVDSADALRTAKSALDHGILQGDFPLITANGEAVTVNDLLMDRPKFHGIRFHDPLEPDYPDSRIAHANLFGGSPRIVSHAHGGQRFTLSPQTKVLNLSSNVYDCIDEVLTLLRMRGDLYDQPTGNGEYDLVFVNAGGYIQSMSESYLRTYMGAAIRFMRFKGEKAVSVAPPLELVKAIHTHSNRGLPKLEAVIRNPVMRPDFSVIDKPGYHPADKLLYISDALITPTIPDAPTDEQISEAFRILWRPFRDFPFDSASSRAAYLALLLTAVVRAVLDTAPGFLIEAPAFGSGKTLLAKCGAHLIKVVPTIQAPPPNDDEARKTLFAELRKGSQMVIFDNWIQPINGGAALCAFLTSPSFSSRILGVSEVASYLNRAILAITGNNVSVENDASRRIVTSRLNADMEHPALRTFDLEPESYVIANQQSMHCAALTLLRGYHAHGAPKQTTNTAGSFEDWDRMIRQCVIWLGKTGFADVELGDPYASAIKAMTEDAGAGIVADMMRAIRTHFGSQYNSAGAIHSALTMEGPLNGPIFAIDQHGMSAVRLGYWLKKHRDRWISGMRIVSKLDSSCNSNVYAVEVRDGAAALPLQPPVAIPPAPNVGAPGRVQFGTVSSDDYLDIL